MYKEPVFSFSVELDYFDSGIADANRPYITNPSLRGGQQFELVQVHWHWDQDDCEGSEHTVDGNTYPLEV